MPACFLEAPIKAEIGEDNGGEMPQASKITWTLKRFRPWSARPFESAELFK
jgi:hypothetical protein